MLLKQENGVVVDRYDLSEDEQLMLVNSDNKHALQIADLIQCNFNNSPFYSTLSREKIEQFCIRNIEPKILTKLNDPQYCIKYSVLNSSGHVIGFLLVKKEFLSTSGGDRVVASVKRYHVDPKYVGRGIGLWMSMVAEDNLKKEGYHSMLLATSNSIIKEKLLRGGYKEYGFHSTSVGELPLLIKQLI